MKTLLKKYSHIWVAGYIFIYLPWFIFLEKTVIHYTIIHVTLDDYIPFCEYFIIPYLLWFVYIAVFFLYFFFTDKQSYYKLCIFLFTGMTVSMLICTFFPNGTNLRVAVDGSKNICSRLVAMVHAADTPTNIFPSVHAYNSLGIHFSIINSQALREKVWLRRCSFLLMIAICLSTVVLKQHSVIDVAGAVILAYVMYPFVYGINYAANRKQVQEEALG